MSETTPVIWVISSECSAAEQKAGGVGSGAVGSSPTERCPRAHADAVHPHRATGSSILSTCRQTQCPRTTANSSDADDGGGRGETERSGRNGNQAGKKPLRVMDVVFLYLILVKNMT